MSINISEENQQTIRLDELAQSLPKEAFTKIQLNLDKPRTVWVVTREIEISQLKGKRSGCYRHEREDFLAQPLILTFLDKVDLRSE